MDFFKRSPILTLLILNFVIFTVSGEEENNWDSEDISSQLQDWIRNAENVPFEVQFSEGREAMNWRCYAEKDVSAAFVIEPTKIKETKFVDLNGQTTARLIFNDKKRILESNLFNQGIAEGQGKITFRANRKVLNEDFFYSGNFFNGCLEGRVRGYSYLPMYDDNDKPIPSNETVMTYIAAQIRGVPLGPVWRPFFSQDGIRTGYLYAEKSGHFSDARNPKNFGGSDLVYIYPDFKTAFRGSFDDKGQMIEAKQVDIIGQRIQEFGGIAELQFSKPFGPIFKTDISTPARLSSNPMLRDPYESKMVTVKTSSLPKAGEGVFVNKDVGEHTVVSYFNGVRLSKNDVHSWNPFKKTSVYLVEMSDEKGNDMFLDIPEKFTDWKKYQASTGHKVNHGRVPNSAYTECQHPRFGKILCLYTLKNLSKGEELFTRYDVSLDKEGMKSAMKIALDVGHWYTGKPKDEFVREVKPILKMAAKMAEQFDVNYFLGF